MNQKLFSGALYKENLKRFWSVAAVGFILYYLSGLYPLSLSRAQYSYYRVTEMLSNQNIGFLFAECILPVVLAVSLFSYLNKANSVNLIHSLPLSRRQLYITNYLSGLTLFTLPILLTDICMILYKKPTYAQFGSTVSNVDMYTYPAIFKWILLAFVTSLFVYSISVLSCAICGNGVIAALTSCALNVVVIIVYVCMVGYAANTYYGYRDDMTEMLIEFHPATALLRGTSASKIVLYAAIAIVISVLADVLYSHRKLERCTDSYVYGWAKHLVGFLFVFICASGIGLIFFNGMGWISYAIGGLIGFLIGQMISRKTFRILDKTGFINLLAYGVGMCIIIGAINIDITGYEKRVPQSSKVEGVVVYSQEFRYAQGGSSVSFNTEDDIKNVIGLHQNIVNDRKELKNLNEYDDPTYFTFIYQLNNGKTMSRYYTLPKEYAKSCPEYKMLMESDAIVDARMAVTKFDIDELEIQVNVYDSLYFGYGEIGYLSLFFEDADKPYINRSEGIIGGLDKEAFWNSLMSDYNDLTRYIGGYDNVGEILISFTRSGMSAQEATDLANSVPEGMSKYTISEQSGIYEFKCSIPISLTMTDTYNWIDNVLKGFN